MLKQRILTGLVLALLFVAVLVFAPASVFTLFVVFVLGVSAWEWANLCNLQAQAFRIVYAFAVVFVSIVFWSLIYQWAWFSLQQLLFAAALWWCIALLWIQSYPSSTILWQSQWARMLMGMAVLVPAILGAYALRASPNGVTWVLAVVFIVAAADSGAYFAGKAFGRTKLSPAVSPGKSWEGVIGGLTLVSGMSLLFAHFHPQISYAHALAIALPTALVSVLGDLLESMLKRFRGIKDSSQLLPGHGGVLDRVDGLVAAIPIFTLGLGYWG